MNKPKKKLRYASPCISWTGTLLSHLICSSVNFNIQVKDLDDVNTAIEDEPENFYFES